MQLSAFCTADEATPCLLSRDHDSFACSTGTRTYTLQLQLQLQLYCMHSAGWNKQSHSQVIRIFAVSAPCKHNLVARFIECRSMLQACSVVLVLICTTGIMASHFRGGIITVRRNPDNTVSKEY